MLSLFFAFAIMAQSSAEIRARAAEQDDANRAALATITFPGFDASDDAVRRSANHYCGKTSECEASFAEARDRFLRMTALERRQKQGLKILAETSDGTGADWRVAETLYNAKYHAAQPPRLPRTTVTCRSYGTARSVYTSCTAY